MLLETYRECLRDFFDMPALVSTLADVRSRKIRVATVDSETPSPFAASLLFSYVASFLYDGDAPLAERRAQALAVDQAQLRELLGDAELRELLDAESMDAVERQLQRLDPKYRARTADGVHDMLLGLGDLTAEEIAARSPAPKSPRAVSDARARAGASSPVRIAGEPRYIAVEDAARYRDALGVPLPLGIPEALLQPVARSARRSRAALRAHARAVHRRRVRGALRRSAPQRPKAMLMRLAVEAACSKASSGPGGTRREWTDANVLRHDPAALAREAAPRSRTGRSGGARPARRRRGRAS